MIEKLPLDSPLWGRLSACHSAENAIARLREVVATRRLGDAWGELREEIIHQGTVYAVSSAAIPHLVDLAPRLPADSRRDLWIEIGFLVTSGADRFPDPPAPGLQEGLTAALAVAESLAVRDFLAGAEPTPDESGYFALACVALAGHRAGRAMWEFPSTAAGYVRVACPECDAEYEMDGFGDPLAPPCPPPAFSPATSPATGTSPAWRAMAQAIEQPLGPGWDGFFDTARHVAAAGVPTEAPSSAVWCLVAAMVATRPPAASWARTLARLAGRMRCSDCGTVWAIADVMTDEADARPAGDVSPETVADGYAGFRPARTPHAATVTVRTLWSAEIGAVDALALVAGRPSTVAAATGDATTMWDLTSGSRVEPTLAGAAAVASVALPDGRAVIATAAGDRTVRRWDAATGKQLGEAAATAPVLSLTPLPMPSGAGPRTVGWLAKLSNGRTLLAAGHADGAVRLWDPETGAPPHDLFQRHGRPVVSLTTAEFGDGPELIAVYGDLGIDVWTPRAVHGNPSGMAPEAGRLEAAGHRSLVGVAVPPGDLAYRKPILLADRDGTVSLWETFGVRLNDPLPRDPAYDEVVGIVALPAPDGFTVVTASRSAPGLRVWNPQVGGVAVVPLDVRPRCLAAAGETVLIGHDEGLLALSL